MKIINKSVFILILTAFITLTVSPVAFAATSPTLGQAAPYSVLSSTFTNTAPGTTLNGDLGYTNGPAVPVTVNGQTHVADSTYNQAGIDQATALTDLNSQPCTTNFPVGAIDLGSDVTHGPVGIYTPGVYCVTGAVSIGGGSTITLNGAGTYIFRSTGALTTSANSIVTLSGGASACNVWWTPGASTTLGANSNFIGTIIDASGVSIGSTITWSGRALAFGGTVSTSVDTINTVPLCASASSVTSTTNKTPGLPNTGNAPTQKISSTMWIAMTVLPASLAAIGISRRFRTIPLRVRE